ncbi:MAG: hypothetical protein AAFX87_16320 [Bacteroidota bacterium]
MRTLLASLLVAFMFVSCAQPKEEQKQTEEEQTASSGDTANEEPKSNKWKEMDDFHLVMAETFHPMEEGNLEPIYTRAEELMTSAKVWSESTIPEHLSATDVKEKLEALTERAGELLELTSAESKDDDQVTTMLTQLHDDFHAITDLYYKSK